MSPALESKGAWNPEVCTRDGEKELQENLPLSGLRMRRGTINIRENGGNPTYFQLFPLPPPHLLGNPVVVVVPTMAAEAEQAPKTLSEGNPFLWSKRLWSQEPRKNLHCFFYLCLSSHCLALEIDIAYAKVGKLQLQLFSQKTRRGPWGPENVTVITVEKKFKRQYHKAVYVHLDSFLSYKFIDLSLDNMPKALRTELWAR